MENGKIKCWKDSFVLGPPCRNPDRPEKCIPYFTLNGWLEPAGLQKIFSYNMVPLALRASYSR